MGTRVWMTQELLDEIAGAINDNTEKILNLRIKVKYLEREIERLKGVK
jgi:hypothetical protein